MSLNRKFAKFFSLAGKQQVMLVEAILLLACACFLVAFFRFRFYQRTLGQADGPQSTPTAAHLEVSDQVRQSIVIAVKNVPWSAVCLPQAMAGRWMLKRRGIDSVLYLGLERTSNNMLNAHAWLEAGSLVVTGWREKDNFAVVARFS